MSNKQQKQRYELFSKLRRNMCYTAPVLALVAGGVALQTNAQAVYASGEAPAELLLASQHAQPEGEAQAEAEGEAEGEAQAEGEGAAEGEAQAEGEAEAGAQPSERTQAVSRPNGYVPGYDEKGDNPASLIARGKALFNDPSLSTNGLSCASCHGVDGQSGYQETFSQPYPHEVAMGTNMFGMETVHADEMVQLCMVAPMSAEPLAWDSVELASLAAYVVSAQQMFVGETDGHCDS